MTTIVRVGQGSFPIFAFALSLATAARAAPETVCRVRRAQLSFHQSNHEGVLVDLIQSARTDADAMSSTPRLPA